MDLDETMPTLRAQPAGSGADTMPCGQIGLRQFRISKRESQATFWARFGVTQSSGSRFETGLLVPPPVAKLIRLYVNGKLSDGDLLD
jgi:hypothetical protein